MKFKKLEVAGFKSFADKLEIKFGAGITAIVGPNGCGKSNVADSIRWVLGEQSAKLLRGHSMSDVIFNGTENRKSLSYSEVSLHFDNREKLFPSLDFDEVVITRKLYRSGESEYQLNKSACRLKDITDLLRDGGMGREGYSIIGQGRIDELLSAKPEDRRTIFEEAAGISKFKARKIDSERKLKRTDDNILRLNDILEEKAKQLEPLTRQSENARKWLGLRDRLKHNEINTYIYQYDTASEAKDVIGKRLSGIVEQLELRNKESDSASMQYNKAMTDLSSADGQIETLREELLTITVDIEKQSGEIRLLNERLGYLSEQSKKLKEDNEKSEREHIQTLEQIDKNTNALQRKKSGLEFKKVEADRLGEQYLKVIGELTEGEGAVEEHHNTIIAAMDKLSEIKSNMSRLLTERENLLSSIEELKRRSEAISEKLNSANLEENSLKSEILSLEGDIKSLTSERDVLITQNNEAIFTINDVASKLDKLSVAFHTTKTRHKMFVEMQETNESFAFSVKKLISDSKKDSTLSSKIEGVVASLISVNEGFETAIETALGNAIQNIVTKSEEDAKYLIEYLKQRKYGRATFLPIASMKPRTIDNSLRGLLSIKGCFGIASDLIKFDKKYDSVMRGLLGGTVITDTINTAIELAKKSGYGFKIVTLEGDVVNPQGSITGGSKKSELNNIFGYDKEINELSKKLATMQVEMDSLNSLRGDAAQKKDNLSKQISALTEKIHAIDVVLASKRNAESTIKSNIESLSSETGNIEFEIMSNSERIAVIEKDINSVGELENIITTQKESAHLGGQERQQKFDSLRQERDRLQGIMMDAKMDVSALEHEISSLENDTKRLQDRALDLGEILEANNAKLAENAVVIERINADMNEFSTKSNENDSERVKQIRHTLANLDGFKRNLQDKIAELDNQKNELVANISELFEKKSREEMLLVKVDTDIEQMQQRILEEYEMDYEQCLQYKEEGYNVSEGSIEINRLKRQMNNLGNINLESIELCKEVYESYHEMDVQRQDLISAKADLEKIISDLSKEMLSRFSDKFEKIRINFIKIFKELFDGGTADLLLLENENLLEAGIEIVAQPPEKKLQSISLLSGGERALTAIAILFAILKLRPMPFCVLDEIEAALDDANAGRFAKYLRRFSEDTQFIVITHRKPTMELADSLYGVTMEEKGVSKIVSVQLADAVANAEVS